VPALQDLYESNYGIRPEGDLTQVDPASVPDHEILTAGFPCQPFSKAGEQLGFEHTEQGQLFFTVARILNQKKPMHFVLENVPNILKHRSGATMKTIIATLDNIGYDVDYARYSPHEFGVPQVRERVYIVGTLRSEGGLSGFTWPVASKPATSIHTVLDSRPADSRPLSAHALRCLETWDEFLRASPDDLALPSFPLWSMEWGANYPYEEATPHALLEERGSIALDPYLGSFGAPLAGRKLTEQMELLPSHARRRDYHFPKWKVDFIRQNRDFYAANREWIDPWLPKIQAFSSSFQKFEWNAKGEQKSIWNFVIQFRASGVRVKRPNTAPSLVAMTDTQVPIIGWERRYMSPRECARLQSLGEIKLPERAGAAYKALGNAVNAEVAATIARALTGRRTEAFAA